MVGSYSWFQPVVPLPKQQISVAQESLPTVFAVS